MGQLQIGDSETKREVSQRQSDDKENKNLVGQITVGVDTFRYNGPNRRPNCGRMTSPSANLQMLCDGAVLIASPY